MIAALHKYLPKITSEVPNTGSLRDDVYTYLHTRVEPLKTISAQTIRGLMMERRSADKITVALKAILKNAELRGEIRLENLTPRIISLPWDLLRSELITKLEPVPDEVIEEIVDNIFIPLVQYCQTKQ